MISRRIRIKLTKKKKKVVNKQTGNVIRVNISNPQGRGLSAPAPAPSNVVYVPQQPTTNDSNMSTILQYLYLERNKDAEQLKSLNPSNIKDRAEAQKIAQDASEEAKELIAISNPKMLPQPFQPPLPPLKKPVVIQKPIPVRSLSGMAAVVDELKRRQELSLTQPGRGGDLYEPKTQDKLKMQKTPDLRFGENTASQTYSAIRDAAAQASSAGSSPKLDLGGLFPESPVYAGQGIPGASLAPNILRTQSESGPRSRETNLELARRLTEKYQIPPYRPSASEIFGPGPLPDITEQQKAAITEVRLQGGPFAGGPASAAASAASTKNPVTAKNLRAEDKDITWRENENAPQGWEPIEGSDKGSVSSQRSRGPGGDIQVVEAGKTGKTEFKVGSTRAQTAALSKVPEEAK